MEGRLLGGTEGREGNSEVSLFPLGAGMGVGVGVGGGAGAVVVVIVAVGGGAGPGVVLVLGAAAAVVAAAVWGVGWFPGGIEGVVEVPGTDGREVCDIDGRVAIAGRWVWDGEFVALGAGFGCGCGCGAAEAV